MLGLVNPKSVLSRYDTRNIKEVLSPLRVAEHNHVGADPHYCALTSNLQVTYAYGAREIHEIQCTLCLHISLSASAVYLMAHVIDVTS